MINLTKIMKILISNDIKPLVEEIRYSSNSKFNLMQTTLVEINSRTPDTPFCKSIKNDPSETKNFLKNLYATFASMTNSLNGETGFLYYLNSLQQNTITGDTFIDFSLSLFNSIKTNSDNAQSSFKSNLDTMFNSVTIMSTLTFNSSIDNLINLITINFTGTNEIIEKIKIDDTKPMLKEIMN
jgi:hypothetical protein